MQAQWQTIRALIGANGLRWTFLFLTFYGVQRLTGRRWRGGQRAMTRLEAAHGYPGVNSLEINARTWRAWNWSRRGEEWTPSAEWKQALIDEVLLKQVAPDQVVLEIGPGGGRWTEPLQKISRELVVVDLSETCIEACRARFADCTNVAYQVGSGRDLSFQPDASVDVIWSFDVFVHIAPPETAAYVAEFARVLRPGGRGIIHHPRNAGQCGGFRSRMTAERFAGLLQEQGLTLVEQFDAWGDGDRHDVRFYEDIITVFERPA